MACKALMAQLLLPHGSLLGGFPNILCTSRAAFLSVILFPGLPFYTRCSVPQTLTNPCILDRVELALNLNLSFSGRPLQSLKGMIRGPSCSPTPQVLPHVTHTTTHAESIHQLLSTNRLPEGRDCVHSVHAVSSEYCLPVNNHLLGTDRASLLAQQ